LILPGKQRVQWGKREAIVRIGTAKRWEPPAPKIGGGGWGLGAEGPRRKARTKTTELGCLAGLADLRSQAFKASQGSLPDILSR